MVLYVDAEVDVGRGGDGVGEGVGELLELFPADVGSVDDGVVDFGAGEEMVTSV